MSRSTWSLIFLITPISNMILFLLKILTPPKKNPLKKCKIYPYFFLFHLEQKPDHFFNTSKRRGDLRDIFDSKLQVCETTMHVRWVNVRSNILYTDRDSIHLQFTTYEPQVNFTTLLQAQWKKDSWFFRNKSTVHCC